MTTLSTDRSTADASASRDGAAAYLDARWPVPPPRPRTSTVLAPEVDAASRSSLADRRHPAAPRRGGGPSAEPPSRPTGGIASEWRLFAAVAAAGVLVPLNSTLLAVALPDIRSDFAVGGGAIAWLISGYLITVAVAQPIAGSLGDQLGRARALRVALLLFVICSLGAAIAPSFELLVLLRVGQGASAATLIPTGFAMLRAVVPGVRLGRMFGFFDSAASTAAATAPLIGALLLEVATWRLLFLVNLPLAAIALWLLWRLDYPDGEPVERPEVDWVGATFLVGILAGITWLFGAYDTDTAGTAILVVSAAVVAVTLGFVGRQVRGRVTIAPWGLFRRPSFAAAIAYALMNNLVFWAVLFSVPFFVREVQDGSVAGTGLLLTAMTVLMAIASPLGGHLSDRIGRRVPAVLGALLILGGVAMLTIDLGPDIDFVTIAVAVALVGAGFGLGSSPAQTAATEIAPRELAGAVNGTDLMVSYVGSIFAAGLLAAVLGGADAIATDVDLFRAVFVVTTVVAAMTVVAALAIHTRVVEPPARS